MADRDSLTELEGDELDEADELLGRAAHDVAKYMAMTARNASPDQLDKDESLSEALRADVLATCGRGPAWLLWRPFSQKLRQLARDPLLARIDSGFDALEACPEEALPLEAGRIVDLSGLITDLRTRVRRQLMAERKGSRS